MDTALVNAPEIAMADDITVIMLKEGAKIGIQRCGESVRKSHLRTMMEISGLATFDSRYFW